MALCMCALIIVLYREHALTILCRVDYQTIRPMETIACPRIFLIGNNRLTAKLKSCREPNRLQDRHVYDLLATRVAPCRYSLE